MKTSEFHLIQNDVSIQKSEDTCDDCTRTRPLYSVVVDFRSAGTTTEIGRYCRACANRVARRIRAGLPVQ